jgi:hypothetical protein
MSRIRTRIQKRDRDKMPQSTPVVSSLESRPFESEADSEGEKVPEVQGKEQQRENIGHNLADLPILSPETAEEGTSVVQAKEDSDSAELTQKDEEQTPQVQGKEDNELVQSKSEEDTEELVQRAQELYEQLLAGDEKAIATVEELGLDLESLDNLSKSEAIAQIQENLEPLVST